MCYCSCLLASDLHQHLYNIQKIIENTTLSIIKQRIKHIIVHDVRLYVLFYLASDLQHYIYNLNKKVHDIKML